jgi:glycerol-3-phosphate O-acyltransferase
VAQHRLQSNESVSTLLFATAQQVAADQGLLDPTAADLQLRRTAFHTELRGILGDLDRIEVLARRQFLNREDRSSMEKRLPKEMIIDSDQ